LDERTDFELAGESFRVHDEVQAEQAERKRAKEAEGGEAEGAARAMSEEDREALRALWERLLKVRLEPGHAMRTADFKELLAALEELRLLLEKASSEESVGH